MAKDFFAHLQDRNFFDGFAYWSAKPRGAIQGIFLSNSPKLAQEFLPNPLPHQSKNLSR